MWVIETAGNKEWMKRDTRGKDEFYWVCFFRATPLFILYRLPWYALNLDPWQAPVSTKTGKIHDRNRVCKAGHLRALYRSAKEVLRWLRRKTCGRELRFPGP